MRSWGITVAAGPGGLSGVLVFDLQLQAGPSSPTSTWTGGGEAALLVRPECAYALRVPAAEEAGQLQARAESPASGAPIGPELEAQTSAARRPRVALLELGLWRAGGAGGGAFEGVDVETLGVSMGLAAANAPRTEPSAAMRINIDKYGRAVETFKFSLLPSTSRPWRDPSRDLALRGRWADSGEPLPGPPVLRLSLELEAPAAGPGAGSGKRAPSARELRDGAFEHARPLFPSLQSSFSLGPSSSRSS
eukprot:tig00001006_g6229.t1